MENLEKWSVGTSTTLFRNFGLESLVASSKAGIRCVELVISRDDPELGAWYAPLVSQAIDLGIDVWSIHLPFGKQWDISSLDKSVRQASIKGNVEIMQRTAAWGPKKMILHPSYEPIPGEARLDRIRLSSDSLATLAEKADKIGVQIAVECLPRTCLGNTSLEMKTLIEGHPSLGLCCDVNHLLQETPQDFIAAMGGKIVSLHISDYDAVDERHWLPGRGVINWPEVITGLVQANYTGAFLFEVSNRHTTEADYVTPESLMTCWNELKGTYGNLSSGARDVI